MELLTVVLKFKREVLGIHTLLGEEFVLHPRNQTTNLKFFKLCLISNYRIIPSFQGLILPSSTPSESH